MEFVLFVFLGITYIVYIICTDDCGQYFLVFFWKTCTCTRCTHISVCCISTQPSRKFCLFLHRIGFPFFQKLFVFCCYDRFRATWSWMHNVVCYQILYCTCFCIQYLEFYDNVLKYDCSRDWRFIMTSVTLTEWAFLMLFVEWLYAWTCLLV